MRASLLALSVLFVGCSSTTTITSPAPAVDAGTEEDAGGSGPFTLTSTAFAEGAAIPGDHVCAMHGGMNVSPPLAWTGTPTEAKSFAIVFNDATTSFLHSVIYDIPPETTELPGGVQKVYQPSNVAGAKQTRSYSNTFGYAGPCPQEKHTYEFVLYALDVDTLPGMTQQTALAVAETAIKAHDVASTKLTGTYTP